MRPRAYPPCAPSVWLSVFSHPGIVDAGVGCTLIRDGCLLSTYQSLHGAVQSMSVVAAELGVGTLQGGVTEGLRLLDTVRSMRY